MAQQISPEWGLSAPYPSAYVTQIGSSDDDYQPIAYDRSDVGRLLRTTDQGWGAVPLEDYGFAGVDDTAPVDFIEATNTGHFVEPFGIMGGGDIMAEVMPVTADGYGMTPIMEVGLVDYAQMHREGAPFQGMLATNALNGDVYEYVSGADGLGFFKRIFKKIKRGVKKGLKYLKKGARWLIKKIPGGKYLLKFGKKLKKLAMKLLRPLAKWVGKWAPALAKIAAFIPGYGPAISAGLLAAGKIAKIMKKTGVTRKKKKLAFKSGAQMKQFKRELQKAARRQPKRSKAQIKAMLARRKRMAKYRRRRMARA